MPIVLRKIPKGEEYRGVKPDRNSREVNYSLEGFKKYGYDATSERRKLDKVSQNPGFKLAQYIHNLVKNLEAKGMNRYSISEALGISYSALDHALTGITNQFRDLETNRKLADLAGVSVMDIFEHYSVVEQRDIDSYLLARAANSKLDSSANWSALTATVGQLSPKRQEMILELFQDILRTFLAMEHQKEAQEAEQESISRQLPERRDGNGES